MENELTDGALVQTEHMQYWQIHNMYKAILQRVFSNKDDEVVWNDNKNDLPCSLVVLVQVFSDKTALKLHSSAFFAYL